MPYKFKLGERLKVVRVIGDGNAWAKEHLFRVGTVRHIEPCSRWPYELSFRGADYVADFSAGELERAPKKAKKRGK